MRNQPTRAEECPAGVHSIFDPCPGDCGKLLEPTEEERAAGLRYHATITTPPPDPGPEIAANIRRLLADTTRHGRALEDSPTTKRGMSAATDTPASSVTASRNSPGRRPPRADPHGSGRTSTTWPTPSSTNATTNSNSSAPNWPGTGAP
ncbi:hypothetical protein ACFQ3Z_16400 [Streptomyces nogalater]